ncbi:MAG: response regulator transcription factor [Paludibacteraceae bacterium]
MKSIDILILDDSWVIREGFYSLFSKQKFVHHVSGAASFDELENLMKQDNYQLVFINPNYLQTNLNRFLQLKTLHGHMKWIGILYAHFSSQLLSRLDGTFNIFDSQETLAGKIQKWLETENDENHYPGKDSLTDREADVLKLLAIGKANKEIAEILNISINTVITHRKNISQKTGIKSVSGLTIYAVVQNLVSIDNY